ncbi:phosphoenolpyruvate--protein phosphotransferase [Ruicaihuangia caeni]|uniref:Phosphoenolpyruvate-protein phosphotransferase n=1 Tax=Ruicaihuangia caeni TaxID=3042517 RepID=A0AAW6TA97_9MICO|nr:phosphoenolpyruvate--protein phosphotransferase [Klugiella sp. YN-L-19]MDI2099334.1 phosphoenolpyruvate--protein phosphotransferase [Klugiella sp. YN-L-19]
MELRGVGVGLGMAIGPVLRMPDPLPDPDDDQRTADAAEELGRVTEALAAVAAELRSRAAAAGGEAQEVLEATALMAEDPMLLDEVRTRIDAGSTGERAVFDAIATFRATLTAMGGYMAERAADLGDVSQRAQARLRGVPAPGVPESDTPFVLVAADLAPADTAMLDLEKVLALVTSEGGPTSHTAILARAKSIPAIVGVGGAAELVDSTMVLVDAAAGTVIVAPSDEQRAEAERAIAERASRAAAPLTPGALADGTSVPLLANLGNPDEAKHAVDLGAEGVGLFRTEFLFLGEAEAPSVERQREAYSRLLQAFEGKKVVVRVLDAGADKPLAFLSDAHEENPALGLRGIRVLRQRETVLRDQLTALQQAAEQAPGTELWVMAPMVSDVEETEYFVELAKSLGLRTVGVMAEVPSLAVLAEQVVAACDFVSIGTNDLTQYTLAADRLLGSVASFQDPWHPAVLRMIKLLGDAGNAAGTPVGVCGEAAADPRLAVVLVGLGVTTLSMTPAALADVRAELATVTLDEARGRAERALGARSAADARAAASAPA